MQFASDNAGPAHPEVLDALAAANEGHAAPYGADELTARVAARIRGIFEAPDAAVHLVATGTAANALALALLAKPWQAMFCAPLTHANVDECHAPEFYTGGAKCHPVGDADKIAVADLLRAIESLPEGDVHVSQRGPIVLTQATERGRIYSLAEIAELAAAARAHGLGAYMDGARFANALAALNCSPAEMTWKAGVDIVSLGATKNGCMGVEAVVVFDPALSWEFELRRKRAAHLFSKHRYLAAQMDAYLEGDLWLRSARLANERGGAPRGGAARGPAGGVSVRAAGQHDLRHPAAQDPPEACRARRRLRGARRGGDGRSGGAAGVPPGVRLVGERDADRPLRRDRRRAGGVSRSGGARSPPRAGRRPAERSRFALGAGRRRR